MNFLYRNTSAVNVPKKDHWEYQQNILDTKMKQCHQNIVDAKLVGNHQGVLQSMSEMEMIVSEQKRRLKEVRKMKDEARARLRRLEGLEQGLMDKEGEWAHEWWIVEEKEKAEMRMMQAMHMVEDGAPSCGQAEAAGEDLAMVMEMETSL